ncbi:Non-canonical purine NTP pyrophosphatase [Candidatus Anstonella stagnisolia]|nr:Non-canonical purine NTP pyrophosphatase [Candidatus Anstonella stagnisolia]
MEKILFITSNPHKFSEAQSLLKKCGINIKRKNLNVSEVRAESCEEVAKAAAIEAYRKIRRPLFVEDSGLFIKSLNGFPGVYSAYAIRKIGLEGILALLKGKSRDAEFVCAICYMDNAKLVQVCKKCKGKISLRQKGKNGFGYDPVFVPAGKKKTFAQDAKTKAEKSHRTAALKALCARLAKR